MKKYRWNILILVLVSFVIMYFIMKDHFEEIVYNLTHADIFYIIIAIFLMLLSILFQSISLHIYLNKINPNYKFKDTCTLMLATQLFNAITPFSSGGQPFQVYVLNKQGIKVAESASALLQNFLSFQLGLTVLGTVFVIINNIFNIIPSSSLLRHIVLIGFAINVLVLLLIFYLGYAKDSNTKVLNKILNIKLIRNKEKLKIQANNKIQEFYNTGNLFKQNKSLIFKTIIFNVISLLILYSIPLFVFYSIGKGKNIDLLDSLLCSSYTYFVGSFVPIPGGTGGLEYGFIEFFKEFTSSTIISTCMILWRTITYYIPMIIGLISLLFIKKKVN